MLCMYVTVCVKYANKFNFKKRKLKKPEGSGYEIDSPLRSSFTG